jgi:hypothetical protein
MTTKTPKPIHVSFQPDMTLSERLELYLRIMHGDRPVTAEELGEACEHRLNAMAEDIAKPRP